MSFICAKHGWRLSQNPCQSCALPEPPKSVSQICFEVGQQIEKTKQKSLEEKYCLLAEKYTQLSDKYVALIEQRRK